MNKKTKTKNKKKKTKNKKNKKQKKKQATEFTEQIHQDRLSHQSKECLKDSSHKSKH